jgi:hypothetical protein
MEISPIPGIRAFPAVKTPPVDPRLSGVFDIGDSPGPGDDSYSGSGRKAAGGQDDEADEPEQADEMESQQESIGSGVNFFA